MGREVLLEVQDESRGPLGCPPWVGRLFQRFGTGQEALLEIRDGSGDPFEV